MDFSATPAILSIVFVTDEVDCSYNPNHETIFVPVNRQGSNPETLAAFWHDPSGTFDATASQPTSAVCWNAGVRCEGEGIYSSCAPVNLDESGQLVADEDADEQAVLRPLSRYIGLVDGIESAKQVIDHNQEVLVSVIGGVTIGYPDVGILYTESPDPAGEPNFVPNFGVGQGCVSADAQAVPPVRLRDFAAAFGENNLFSVCDTDFGPALRSIADEIREEIRPACMPMCVADIGVDETGLQPQCDLELEVRRDDGSTMRIPIPQCEDGNRVPAGSSHCYVSLTTPDVMDPRCVSEGWNLQFELVSASDVESPVEGPSGFYATCQPSIDPQYECPGLPI